MPSNIKNISSGLGHLDAGHGGDDASSPGGYERFAQLAQCFEGHGQCRSQTLAMDDLLAKVKMMPTMPV